MVDVTERSIDQMNDCLICAHAPGMFATSMKDVLIQDINTHFSRRTVAMLYISSTTKPFDPLKTPTNASKNITNAILNSASGIAQASNEINWVLQALSSPSVGPGSLPCAQPIQQALRLLF